MILKRFLVVQNLKIAENSVFIFSKLFVCHEKRQNEGKEKRQNEGKEKTSE